VAIVSRGNSQATHAKAVANKLKFGNLLFWVFFDDKQLVVRIYLLTVKPPPL
jgi:hypothetical protein